MITSENLYNFENLFYPKLFNKTEKQCLDGVFWGIKHIPFDMGINQQLKDISNLVWNKIAERIKQLSKFQTYGICNDKYFGNSSNLIVSLTSLPNKLEQAALIIENIMLQTKKANKIVLYIDETKKDSIIFPELLKSQFNRGLEIRWVKDVGPITKIIYALQEFSNDCIISVDDDVFLIDTIFELYIQKYNEYRNFTGLDKFIIAGFPYPPSKIIYQLELNLNFCPDNFAEGYTSVFYAPKVLSGSDVFDINNMLKLSPNNDDIWLYTHECLNKINVFPLITTNIYIGRSLMINSFFKGTLSETVNAGKTFEDCWEIGWRNPFRKCKEYYGLK